MKNQSLSDIYSSLGLHDCTVYVVPKIRYNFPVSDYLYLLYKPVIEKNEYSIKSLSVFGHLKFVLVSIFQRKVILHYHWLEFQDMKSFLGMFYKLPCLFFYNIFGGKLVWTIHNLEPHGRKYLKSHLRIHKWMGKIADSVHVHSETASNLVQNKFDIRPEKIHILKHPEFPSTIIDREKSINFLNESFNWNLNDARPIALIWGNIAEYKKIDQILELLKKYDLDLQVVVAGSVKQGEEKLSKRVEKLTSSNPDFYLNVQFIEEEHIPYFFGASDFCLFNFEQILTSGSVEMALSYNKEIIAPRIGDLMELDDAFLFSNTKELVTLIRSSIFTFYNE